MKAIRIYEHGGPEVLRFEEMPRPIPRATEVLVRNEAIGVNFVDTQHRAGLNYPVTLRLIPGIESIGEAARAHRLLESREVVGKLVLLP
jgi:NADPH2:quinone reductase